MRSAARTAAGFCALIVGWSCTGGPRAESSKPSFDPAIGAEQLRRIAAFDSVVRTVNTDSAYRVWHAMLTSKRIRVDQLKQECEYDRLAYRYGRAAFAALTRMEDTLWRHDDPRVVARMDAALGGASPEIGRETCGPPPAERARQWLREWSVPELPQLPPSPDSGEVVPPRRDGPAELRRKAAGSTGVLSVLDYSVAGHASVIRERVNSPRSASRRSCSRSSSPPLRT